MFETLRERILCGPANFLAKWTSYLIACFEGKTGGGSLMFKYSEKGLKNKFAKSKHKHWHICFQHQCAGYFILEKTFPQSGFPKWKCHNIGMGDACSLEYFFWGMVQEKSVLMVELKRKAVLELIHFLSQF